MNTPEFHDLSTVQQMALRLLAQGETLSATAAECKIDRKTLYNWLHHNPQFAQCLADLQEQLNQMWAAQLAAATQNALHFINQLITDASAPPALRLKAALAVLTREQKGGWPRAIHHFSPTVSKALEEPAKPATIRQNPAEIEILIPQNSPHSDSGAEPPPLPDAA